MESFKDFQARVKKIEGGVEPAEPKQRQSQSMFRGQHYRKHLNQVPDKYKQKKSDVNVAVVDSAKNSPGIPKIIKRQIGEVVPKAVLMIAQFYGIQIPNETKTFRKQLGNSGVFLCKGPETNNEFYLICKKDKK